MTLVWVNLVLSHKLIGIMFGVHSCQTVSQYINGWMPVLGEHGDMLSNLLLYLDTKILKELEPYSYEDIGLENIGGALYKSSPRPNSAVSPIIYLTFFANAISAGQLGFPVGTFLL
jgi:hypothetical protein